MKNISKLLLGLTVFTVLFLSGCKDPVFYYIDNDVVSEEATINGVVRSIARYTTYNDNDEYIVTVGDNGIVYKRVYESSTGTWVKNTQAHGKWITIGESQLPFSLHKYDYVHAKHEGQQILKVVSDSECIYLVTASFYDTTSGLSTPQKINIWSIKPEASDTKDGHWKTLKKEDWTDVIGKYNEAKGTDLLKDIFYEKDSYTISDFNVFSTNASKNIHRKAYIRVLADKTDSANKYKYFEISDSILSDKTDSVIPVDSTKTGKEVAVNGVIYFNGPKFFTTSSATTNETYSDDATIAFWGSGSKLKYSADLSDPDETKDSADAEYRISSIAVCSDAVILGLGQENSSSTSSSGGVEKVQLKADGTPESKLGKFTTNAQTQLLSAYMVSIVFNTNPGNKELESALYAGLWFVGSTSSSSVSFDNEGLWSYYPARGNWNRE